MAVTRILVVDDEPVASDLLRRILESAGYEVWEAFGADEAITMLHRQRFDLVTLDVMMPHIDGFECCRRIRAFSQVPVIFVSGRGEVEAEVTGLEVGADDYIHKPYQVEAVVSRVRAVLRRTQGQEVVDEGRLVVGPLVLVRDAHEGYLNGEPLGLTHKEFALLVALAEECGRIVDQDELGQRVWGEAYDPESKALRVHIYRLRGKLNEHGSYGEYLVTKRERGYLLSPLLREAD